MFFKCHTVSFTDTTTSAEANARGSELEAWVMLNVRLRVCVQWAAECLGALRWYVRFLCSECSCGDPNGFVSFCMAVETLLDFYGVLNLEDLGARLLGTEVYKRNLCLESGVRDMAVPIC